MSHLLIAIDKLRQTTLGTKWEGRLYLVGGIVRDELLGRPLPPDVDIVTEADALELAHWLHTQGITDHLPVTYPRFGTAMVHIEGVQVELVTARRERHGYLRQITADRWDEEHKLLSEQIRSAMLPQLDMVVYPDDWAEIDARRGAPVHGSENAEQAWKDAIRKKLDVQLTLKFTDMDIKEVVEFLQRNTEVNFVLDPAVVAEGKVPPVQMEVANIKLVNALEFIMLQTGLKYALQDEAIFISTADKLRGEASMKVYDIRDMMVGLTQFLLNLSGKLAEVNYPFLQRFKKVRFVPQVTSYGLSYSHDA